MVLSSLNIIAMYKVLVNTEAVVKERSTPLRRVYGQDSPARGTEVKKSEQYGLNLRKIEGEVHLFRLSTNENESSEVSNTLQANNIAIKSQVLLVCRLTHSQLQEIVSVLEARKQSIEMVEVISSKAHPTPSFCLIVYFTSFIISEEVYSLLVLQHFVLAVYVKQTIIVPREQSNLANLLLVNESSLKEMAQLQCVEQQQWIELPTCLKCLQKLESSITGIPSHLFKSSNRPPCSTCAIITEHQQDSNHSKCEDCHSTHNTWICMVCSRVGCGRYSNADACKHFQSDGHILALDLETQRVWNYLSDCFSHRIIPIGKQDTPLKFPESGGGQATNPMYQESLDGAFYEYCSVVSAELERQRAFYQKQSEVQEDKFMKEKEALEAMIKQQEIELQEKQIVLRKQNKKKRKNEKRVVELKEKCKDDRQILNNYEQLIKETKEEEISSQELQKDPRVLQKRRVLEALQRQIEQAISQLTA